MDIWVPSSEDEKEQMLESNGKEGLRGHSSGIPAFACVVSDIVGTKYPSILPDEFMYCSLSFC